MLEGALIPDTVRGTSVSDIFKEKKLHCAEKSQPGCHQLRVSWRTGALGWGVLIPADPGCCLRAASCRACLEAATWGRREEVEGAPMHPLLRSARAAREGSGRRCGGQGTSCRAPWASWHTLGPSDRPPEDWRVSPVSLLLSPAAPTIVRSRLGMLPVKHRCHGESSQGWPG